ncbi:MAG: hypothetical protein GW941_02665 [Candidatus Pacebacteria bacterium]|nr:hypothetical protein [Candidatus Paceibacterota bacterium]
MLENWYQSLSIIFLQTLSEFSIYLPKIVAALAIFIVGITIANTIKNLVVKTLDSLKISKALKDTPIEHFITNSEAGKRVEQIIGSVVYWIIMLVIIQTSIAILGLTSLSHILQSILAFVPNIISAVLILFFGVLLAGLVEGLVKGSIKSIDPKTGRALGKLSSYLVMTVGVLISISEIGIASEFILILFVGFIFAISLGIGLSIGLGGKDLVKKLLDSYYKDTIKKQ